MTRKRELKAIVKFTLSWFVTATGSKKVSLRQIALILFAAAIAIALWPSSLYILSRNLEIILLATIYMRSWNILFSCLFVTRNGETVAVNHAMRNAEWNRANRDKRKQRGALKVVQRREGFRCSRKFLSSRHAESLYFFFPPSNCHIVHKLCQY